MKKSLECMYIVSYLLQYHLNVCILYRICCNTLLLTHYQTIYFKVHAKDSNGLKSKSKLPDTVIIQGVLETWRTLSSSVLCLQYIHNTHYNVPLFLIWNFPSIFLGRWTKGLISCSWSGRNRQKRRKIQHAQIWIKIEKLVGMFSCSSNGA